MVKAHNLRVDTAVPHWRYSFLEDSRSETQHVKDTVIVSALGFTGFSMDQGFWSSEGVWTVETDMYIAVQPNLQELSLFY